MDLDCAWALLLDIRRRCRRGERLPLTLSGGSGACAGGEPLAVVAADGTVRLTVPADPEAAALIALHAPMAIAGPGRPHVVGHLGQSLDGRIATAGGSSHYVNGCQNLDHLHRLRALADAVLVGGATVALDDPRLTTRRVAGDNPVRVVIDRGRRLPSDRRIFTDQSAPTVVICDAALARGRSGGGCSELVGIDGRGDDLPPSAILEALGHRGLHCILVEGGGLTVSRFLREGRLDRLQLAVAPILIGSGRPSITLPEIAGLSDAMRPECRTFAMGDDILYDCRLAPAAGV